MKSLRLAHSLFSFTGYQNFLGFFSLLSVADASAVLHPFVCSPSLRFPFAFPVLCLPSLLLSLLWSSSLSWIHFAPFHSFSLHLFFFASLLSTCSFSLLFAALFPKMTTTTGNKRQTQVWKGRADVIIDQAVFCCSACQSVPVPSVQLRLMRECPLLRAEKSAVEASCNVNNITKLLILLPKRLDWGAKYLMLWIVKKVMIADLFYVACFHCWGKGRMMS